MNNLCCCCFSEYSDRALIYVLTYHRGVFCANVCLGVLEQERKYTNNYLMSLILISSIYSI